MIPVCEPLLIDRDRAHVADCLQQGWISSSAPVIGEFEERWAAYCGRRHGVAVSNGTSRWRWQWSASISSGAMR